MAFEGLVTELKRLIRERVPGYKAKESVESFGEEVYSLDLRYVSSMRTFGSSMSKEYEDGQTVVCDWEGQDLKVAVMMMPSANDWVRERSKGDKFELSARLLSYDTLYDRAIFGHALTDEDGGEQEPSDSVPVPGQAQPAPVKERPVQPQDVIRQSIRQSGRVKLPKKAKTRKVSKQRKLYGKSSQVASPSRNKQMFWGKPRKLKVVKRSEPSPKGKRVGHAAPSRKPLKRTLKSAPKAPNPRRNEQRRQPPPLKFLVSRGPVAPATNPADIVRILQKKKERGIMALSLQEKQALQRAGLGEAVKDSLDGFDLGMGCLMAVGILLIFISIPFCGSSGASGFGIMSFWLGLAMCIPRFAKILKS
jgi:hypothetical protein